MGWYEVKAETISVSERGSVSRMTVRPSGGEYGAAMMT
jgi:hypothetical protein